MPPPPIQNSNSSSRRSTGSMRQRENRVHNQHQQPNNAVNRRRKSRSPAADARVSEDAQVQNDVLARRRKRLPPIPGSTASSSNTVNVAMSRSSWHEDSAERGRTKAKPKPRAVTMWIDEGGEDIHMVTNIVQDNNVRGANAQAVRPRRKERSRSRDTGHRSSRKTATPEPMDEEDEQMYTGPLAHAEYVRMKVEMDKLRKQVALAKQTVTRQSKVIDELRAELTITHEANRSQSTEMEKLKTQSKKSTDLIATMETNLTCQICMEVMLKPYGLSPCGHVLCMTCLLSWFKAAPASADDMYDDDTRDLCYRKKSCPCCRTVVRTRPIPLYLVKSLASALEKSRAPPGPARPSPPPDDEDPWAGVFHDPDFEEYSSSDDEEEDDEDDEGDEGEDGEEGEGYEDDYWPFDGYGTDEEDERYTGEYVNPVWAPPNIFVDPEEYTFLDDDAPELMLLRRGATLSMIQLFHMTYDHDTGICALVEGGNIVHLGWNIDLHADDDSGEEFMDWVLADMYERPERWRVVNYEDEGTWSAWKLVPQDEVEEYSDTDSEAWVPDEIGFY